MSMMHQVIHPVLQLGSEPQAVEHYFFQVTAFEDGSAVVAWNGADGSPVRAYLPTFDLRYQGQVMQEMVRSAAMYDSGLPYDLEVWSWAAQAGPTPSAIMNLQPPASELPTLAKLTNQTASETIIQLIYAAVDWRLQHPSSSELPGSIHNNRFKLSRVYPINSLSQQGTLNS